MRRLFVSAVVAGLAAASAVPLCSAAPPETVRLQATADVWLSSSGDEVNSSAGKAVRIKLKSIQEIAAIRFDAAPARGREVLKAALFLRRQEPGDMLRYIRVSTVNQNWEEGNGTNEKGPEAGVGDGATYGAADFASKRPWAWPGSEFCDVIMSSGQSLAMWAERKELENDWISVPLTPAMIYALACEDTDGLAVMDGGTLSLHNNYVYSCQSKGNEPYIEVELGGPLDLAPAVPAVQAQPAPERATAGKGAVRLTVQEAKNVFCWKVSVNGKPVERWRVHHPKAAGPTVFFLEDLEPAARCDIEIAAVAPGGKASAPAKLAVTASPALAAPPDLGAIEPPKGGARLPDAGGRLRAWAFPPLVKISPETGAVMFGDEGDGGDVRAVNAVWNGKEVHLAGARGEYVSFQVCVENLGEAPLAGVKVSAVELKGKTGAIGGTNVELYKAWYARNRSKQWQPAYALPLAPDAALEIPDPARKLETQKNQSVYVDVYVPKDAQAGDYAGVMSVQAEGVGAVSIPVQVTVYDFALPDKLSFWPELNAYRIPRKAHDYYRLAHQHRCVLNASWRPRLAGAGAACRVIWDDYDKNAGPLLSGEAFKDNRRASQPVDCMYLPFEDGWPTELTKKSYAYAGHWPGRGEDNQFIDEHYLKAPYIGDALSQDYKDAFLAVQRQFVEHFKEKGWNRTEMQCFYGGKNTHRTQYGVNMWWTTDEPYHLDDWLALQFFCRLWTQGREALGADRHQWSTRGDISRPNWEGRFMEGILDTQYGAASAAGIRRLHYLRDDTGVKINNYGSANGDNASNHGSIALFLGIWLAGGNSHLPWQSLGEDRALDTNDTGGSGNALLVPGDRFGLPVVGDLRLKAIRDAEQLIEYLKILGDKRGLNRDQLGAMVQKTMSFEAGRKAGANADNADAMTFSTIHAWQLAELRQRVARLIVEK